MRLNNALNVSVMGMALVALVACSENEAGSTLANPTFGVAATQNRISQLSILAAGGRAVSLGAIFQEEVEDTVYFEFGSSELDLPARLILDQQAAWLRDNPGTEYEIEGHADLVGTPERNAELGLARANAVLNYIVSTGVDRRRLTAVASFGEERPAVDTEDRERLNRRVTTRVTGTEEFFAGPGFDGLVARNIYNRYRTGSGRTLDAAGQVGSE